MDSEWLYRSSPDNKECFILGETGENPLVYIGVVPGESEPGDLDETLTEVKARAESLGYDSWIMINIYPQRVSDPDQMHKRLNHRIHRNNLKEIKKYISGSCHIWAAWGSMIEKRTYLARCLKDIYEVLGSDRKWIIIGKRTFEGHPHHPLYLKKNMKFDLFDISAYLEKRLH